MIPKVVDGRNKLFFFANYSHVNDFIPGKNQASSTVPASEAQLDGDFSDLLRLAEPGAVPDLRSADGPPRPREPEPLHPRSVPEQHHPGEPHREPALQPVPADGAAAESEPVENGATPTGNYYRGGEPDKPVSSLYAGRIDYNMSSTIGSSSAGPATRSSSRSATGPTRCRSSRDCTRSIGRATTGR